MTTFVYRNHSHKQNNKNTFKNTNKQTNKQMKFKEFQQLKSYKFKRHEERENTKR